MYLPIFSFMSSFIVSVPQFWKSWYIVLITATWPHIQFIVYIGLFTINICYWDGNLEQKLSLLYIFSYFFASLIREDAHVRKSVSGRTTNTNTNTRGGKAPRNFFSMIFKKLPKNTRKINKKKYCMLCSVLVNIDQQKNIIDIFGEVSENIIF